MFVYWDTVLQKAKKDGKAWASIEEYRRLPLACLGVPAWVISLFWLVSLTILTASVAIY